MDFAPFSITRGEGSKKEYLRHQKKDWNPLFLWPLQQFGDKTEHFCGICIVLEVEPLARKVFAGHWTWKSSISQGLLPFCEHLGLDAAVWTAPATLWSSNLSLVELKLYLGLKFVYGWFRVD